MTCNKNTKHLNIHLYCQQKSIYLWPLVRIFGLCWRPGRNLHEVFAIVTSESVVSSFFVQVSFINRAVLAVIRQERVHGLQRHLNMRIHTRENHKIQKRAMKYWNIYLVDLSLYTLRRFLGGGLSDSDCLKAVNNASSIASATSSLLSLANR